MALSKDWVEISQIIISKLFKTWKILKEFRRV